MIATKRKLFYFLNNTMNISYYIDKWVSSETIYWKDEFQEIDNLKHVMEEDRTFAKSNFTYVFGKCIGVIGNFLIILDKRGTIRIKPKLINYIYQTPKFEWGNSVQEIKRPEIKGKIESLFWHLKDNEYKYFIRKNGKVKSRRYDEHELIKIPIA